MILGTRGSDLALWQARFVRASLLQATGVEPEIVIIKTQGDTDQTASFDKMEGKGFFTKEIEAALLDGQIDLAVHSLKDLQTTMPAGLTLGAILQRADRRDMLLIRPESVDPTRPLGISEGATVGTSSARRVAQLQFLRPDLKIVPLRGNVPTRVHRLRDARFDAVLIASAGVNRLGLGLDGLTVRYLPEEVLVPAPGQGALAVQIRDGDDATRSVVSRLNDPDLAEIVWLEREVLRRLEGGCQLPLGTAATRIAGGGRLHVFLKHKERDAPSRFVIAGKDRFRIADMTVSALKGTLTLPKSPNVWITRDTARSTAFEAQLDPGRWQVNQLPVLQTVPAGKPQEQANVIRDLHSCDWIIFTSQNAVAHFAHLLTKHAQALTQRQHLAAVGEQTARAMREQGWSPEFVSEVADGRSLGETLLPLILESGADANPRVLFPCSVRASHDLQSALAGVTFVRFECYDTREHPDLAETLPRTPEPGVIVFTSPSAVDILLSRRTVDREAVVVSIGPATTDTLLAQGFPLVWEPAERSMAGLARMINGLYADSKTTSSPTIAAHP